MCQYFCIFDKRKEMYNYIKTYVKSSKKILSVIVRLFKIVKAEERHSSFSLPIIQNLLKSKKEIILFSFIIIT